MMLDPILFFKQLTPDQIQENQRLFYFGEIFFAAIALTFAWRFRPKSPESGFNVRESERIKAAALAATKSGPKYGKDPHQAAKKEKSADKKSPALALPGIGIHGKPHEILGIRKDASEKEIQEAYKKLMKQYHPDKIGRADSAQWKEAQKIAEALNRARAEMLGK